MTTNLTCKKSEFLFPSLVIGAKIEVDDLEAIVVEEEIGPEIKIAGVLMDQTVHSSNKIYQIQFQAAMVLFLLSQ